MIILRLFIHSTISLPLILRPLVLRRHSQMGRRGQVLPLRMKTKYVSGSPLFSLVAHARHPRVSRVWITSSLIPSCSFLSITTISTPLTTTMKLSALALISLSTGAAAFSPIPTAVNGGRSQVSTTEVFASDYLGALNTGVVSGL